MRKLFCVAGLILCLLSVHRAHAAACNLSSGASQSTIQAALTAAGNNSCTGTASPTTVALGAGSYNISSTVTIPCNVTFTGPVVAYVRPNIVVGSPNSYSYSNPYKATLNGSTGSNSGFAIPNNCSNVTVQYFNWNGGQPSGGGGGFIFVNPGVSNITIQNNYLHGSQASVATSHESDSQVWLDGPQSQTPVDTNVTVQWNVFGDGVSDCSNIMGLFTYQGNQYSSSGGYCGGMGVHVSTTNLLVQNNDFEHIEQGMKFFSGAGGVGSYMSQMLIRNGLVQGNDFGSIHRISLEAQQVPFTTIGYVNNSVHDLYDQGYGSFGFSIPQCCSQGYFGGNLVGTQQLVNCIGNVMDNPSKYYNKGDGTGGYYTVEAFEWWSQGSCSNNLIQGNWGAGVSWGYTNPPVAANNNVIQLLENTSYIVIEKENGQNPNGPTKSGNVESQTLSALISGAPVISPSPSGAYSAPVSVTITDNGLTNGTGPQGNTSVFYTTDGSAPSTASTGCKSPCVITVAPGSTVSAIGMWGAANQPGSYLGGYGFVPSAAAKAVYTAALSTGSPTPPAPPTTPTPPPTTPPPTPVNPTPTLTGAALSSTANANTMVTATNLQFMVTGAYSDGTTSAIPNSSIAWSSSNSAALTVNGAGLATAVAAGTANVLAKVGTICCAPWTVTVSAPPTPTLKSATLSSVGNANTLVVAKTLQFSVNGVYSNGTSSTVQNSNVTWSTSNANVLTVNAAGLATAVTAGSANVGAKVGTICCAPWTVTVSAPPAPTLKSATLSSVGNANTMTTGKTLQFSATGVYSDGSSAVVPGSGVAWSSSNPAVLSIDSNGLVTAIGAGVANVVAQIGTLCCTPWTVTVKSPTPVSGPAPAAPGAPVSDTFEGPFWKTITPSGGSTSMSNGHLFLAVPGGSNHDAITPSNQAVQAVQAIGNVDFDVSIKIDSPLVASDPGTSQGLIISTDSKDYITFALTTDGSKIGLSAHTVIAGTASTVLNDTDLSAYQTPMYLKITKNVTTYVAFYSVDGSNWLQAATFTDDKVPNQVGPFASNYNESPAAAVPVVMSVNWFNVQ